MKEIKFKFLLSNFFLKKLFQSFVRINLIAAFLLQESEICQLITNVREFVTNDIDDVLFFYYPRQWTKGEIIWTPAGDKVAAVQNKYLSSSTVYTSELQELHDSLQSEEIGVIFLLIDFVFEMKVPDGREFIVKISASAEKIRDFKLVIVPLVDHSYQSQQGHIIVRVLPGGKNYYLIILADSLEDMLVKNVFGPYTSKQNYPIDGINIT